MNFMHEGPVMMPNGVLNVHPLGAPVLNNNSALGAKNGAAEIPEESAPEEQAHIDIIPRNVVCSFSVGCHLDLKKIAWHGCNVQYRHPTNVVLMKLRHPLCTAHIWSSGKVTCTGAATEADAKRASRKIARFLQKLEFPVKFRNYRVVNVLATCNFPFGIKLADLYGLDRANAQYEPELHPGLTFKCPDLSASLKIFSTGSVTITAPSLGNITKAVERAFPLCVSSRKPKPLLPGKAKDVKEDDDGDFDVLLESPDVPNL